MILDESLKALTLAFLGSGTMVALLKFVGTADWDKY
jgi:hypothetical protein